MGEGEDRIKTEFTLGYKAINLKGEKTIEITPFTMTISDQSPAAASAHLIATVMGLLAPSQAQIK